MKEFETKLRELKSNIDELTSKLRALEAPPGTEYRLCCSSCGISLNDPDFIGTIIDTCENCDIPFESKDEGELNV